MTSLLNKLNAPTSGNPCDRRDPSLDNDVSAVSVDGARVGHLPAQVSAEIELGRCI